MSVRAGVTPTPPDTYANVPLRAMSNSATPVGSVTTWGSTGNRRADHLQPIEVERDRTQRAGRRVHQMPTRHELRLAAAPQQRLLRAGSQVEDRHLRRLDSPVVAVIVNSTAWLPGRN